MTFFNSGQRPRVRLAWELGPVCCASNCVSLCAGGQRYFLVSGNPGVGKLVWLLFQLAVVRVETIVIQMPTVFLFIERLASVLCQKSPLM